MKEARMKLKHAQKMLTCYVFNVILIHDVKVWNDKLVPTTEVEEKILM